MWLWQPISAGGIGTGGGPVGGSGVSSKVFGSAAIKGCEAQERTMRIPIDEVVTFDVVTHSASTGAATDADSTPTFEVFEDTTDTDIGVGGNLTKRTSKTGNYRGTFTASAANGFEAGKWYSVIASATVGGIAAKAVAMHFMAVPAESSAGVPKVDVSHFGGSAGTFNAGIPETKVASIANGAIVEASFANNAITDAKVASDVTIASVTGAVGSVTGAVGSVTGNVGGNVAGSVGSVTGNVGGNVVGTVASVVGNVGGNVTGSVGSLATQAKADVNAEVLDVMNVDTHAEPGQGSPAATTTIFAKINYLYKLFRNKKTQSATTFQLWNDAETVVDQKSAISKSGGTVTRGEIVSGP